MSPETGVFLVIVIVVGFWFIGFCMPIWTRCDGPGCTKESGKSRNDCKVCGGFGYTEPTPVISQYPAASGPYIHDYECFMGGTEKALGGGRLWICAKCGDATDQLVPNIRGCDVAGEPKDPSQLVAAIKKNREM